MLIVISILIIFNLLPKKVNDGKLCETVFYVMKCDDIQYILTSFFVYESANYLHKSKADHLNLSLIRLYKLDQIGR